MTNEFWTYTGAGIFVFCLAAGIALIIWAVG